MLYFLDFDRVLFDTDAYNASLPDEPGCAPFADELRAVVSEKRDETLTGGAARIAAWEKVSDALSSGALTFAPGYLSRFVYKDVPELLRGLGNEAVIITYGEYERQRAKVESALSGIVRLTVLYTKDVPKAGFLASWPGYNGQKAVFVDDRVAELEALGARFPALALYEMRRDGKKGDGRWPVLRSLAELP
ncbi:MAG: hypothetical protein KGI41_02765 [Patescibacteria group bacterium]|nr:hypothetical protein [Patescibacteria group bacterium]